MGEPEFVEGEPILSPPPSPNVGLRVGSLAFLLLGASWAGCIRGQDVPGLGAFETDIQVVFATVEDTTRGEEEYWMVTITGNETDKRDPQAVCMREPPNYAIHHHNESLVYDADRYAFAPSQVHAMLAFDHEDRTSHCPEAEHLAANPAGPYKQEMGEYGQVRFEVFSNGTVLMDETRIPLGQAAIVTYAGNPGDSDATEVDGAFRVQNHGAWEQEDIWRGQP